MIPGSLGLLCLGQPSLLSVSLSPFLTTTLSLTPSTVVASSLSMWHSHRAFQCANTAAGKTTRRSEGFLKRLPF
ncbi:hypothetical protein DL89DRAFT_64108 [Linderina pennispora]|uniref:Secreted protein n=1 Tax=Linderina pennispora TaxID=61395 RepID=A0A1Y1VZM9_9FUNG|nr:uncharacterized protein DL89DRAFT_64108 [Linderina pennispora]ORX66476.1 hypothetical protein DL89DRAFT_64108 [Linderina pennispora]